MKTPQPSGRLVFLLIASVALGGGAFAEEPVALAGRYQADDDSGPLEAMLTPTGDGTWQADFYFSFQEQPLAFSGFAEGSLTDGLLEGTVQNERGNRTFTFEGHVEGGRFTGTHSEIEGGVRFPTGTLTLKPSSG